MFSLPVHLCFFFFLFAFSMMANGQIFDNDPWVRFKVGKGLSGRSSVMGYNFDGPVERGAVRAWRWGTTRGQVTDCPSRCRHYHGRSGQCVRSRSNDCSADCGCGFVCRCN